MVTEKVVEARCLTCNVNLKYEIFRSNVAPFASKRSGEAYSLTQPMLT